jgi:hypothetical protein
MNSLSLDEWGTPWRAPTVSSLRVTGDANEDFVSVGAHLCVRPGCLPEDRADT